MPDRAVRFVIVVRFVLSVAIMTIKKILCAIDFSEGSHQAMRSAAQLANERDAELVLVHAWNFPPAVAGNLYSSLPLLMKELATSARTGIDSAISQTHALGVKRLSGIVVEGTPWQAIVQLAEDDQAIDLVVVGTLGRTGIARAVLGSVAAQVVRHAPCPVLTVRRSSEPRPYRHILVPYFSPTAHAAVDLAIDVVARDGQGADITLVHVLEIPTDYHGDLRPPDAVKTLDPDGARLLDEALALLRKRTDASVFSRVRIGSAAGQVLAMLDHERKYDLVICGSHGRTGAGRFLLGSVAEKLVRHAACPVLVAHVR